MFKKYARYNLTDIQPLNEPVFKDGIIRNQHLVVNANAVHDVMKIITANTKESKLDDKTAEFNLEAEIQNHPDSLFVKCFAIKADEPNDNGDFFAKMELVKATPTFVGVPIFTNHQNSDINEARGKVIHSWWDESRNGIMIIARVDAAAYPQLARGIKEKYMVGTSMGCKVKYSLCSACHNYAENPSEYCSCVKERKTRHAEVKKQKCNYHKQGPEDKCPLCESTEKDIKTFAFEGKIFEHNYGVEFIENSFVVSPACHDCGVTEVIDPQVFLSKVSSIEEKLPKLIKEAQEIPVMCTDKSCIRLVGDDQVNIINNSLSLLRKGSEYIANLSGLDFLKANCKNLMKSAGQQEIANLNQALDLITSVSQAMLSQKEQLDLEFLSDLVSVLSDLQAVTDELTEQGYGRLQSPTQSPQTPQAGAEQNAAQPPASEAGQASKAPQTFNNTPSGAASSAIGPLAKKSLDMKKLSSNLLVKHKNLEQSIRKQASLTRRQISLKFQIPSK